jgi:hypothetical protein
MRSFLSAIAFFGAAATATAQVRVSGRVVDQSTGTPISGVLVRVTGSDSTLTTGASGTFAFGNVLAGKFIITLAAPSYVYLSIPLEAYSDTTLAIAMRQRVVALDPMVVRPTQVRIKGTVVDSATGEPLLFAQVTVFPEGRYVDASNIGRFTLDKVPTGPALIVAEAIEHVPVTIQLDALRDTTITFKLPTDSTALRMIARQVQRLQNRAQSFPLALRALGRKDIVDQHTIDLGDLLRRQVFMKETEPRKRRPLAACVYLDDRPVDDQALDGLDPEMFERIEIIGSTTTPKIIAVYTKRYVYSLARQASLNGVRYQQNGTSIVC